MKKKKKESVVFFTFVSDDYYYGVGTPVLINSFKRFHPDIELVVFRQDMIDKIFKSKGVNFYNAKPTFAKLLAPHFDLVVNIDADTIVTCRLDEVLKQDYEVGAAWNFNDYENASMDGITEEMYLQAGLVASRNPKFWDYWEDANRNAMAYLRQENDILNLVCYKRPEVKKMKLKIFDKDKDYYGCKSLNREKEMYIENGKLMLRKEQVKAYHWAKGGCLPKMQFEKLPFTDEVINYLRYIAHSGITCRYATI
jgi:hypothetical protein